MTEPTTDATAEASPTCYRHPDRETYVRCTRCDRSICPDCMKTASVGFQCPECVREGNKTIRQARTQFGGRVTSDVDVTKILLGLNVVLFVAQLTSSRVTSELAMWNTGVFAFGDYYRMITSAFLHDPNFLLHIVVNGFSLLMLGSEIERLVGVTRYLALYFVAALGGSVGTLLFGSPRMASVGASGALFGLFGAYFVLKRSLRADTSFVVGTIVMNVVIGFVFRGYINHYAHAGGLVTGAAIAWFYTIGRERGPRDAGRRTAIHLGGAAAIALVLVAATAWRVRELRAQYPVLVRIEASSAAAVSPETPSR